MVRRTLPGARKLSVSFDKQHFAAKRDHTPPTAAARLQKVALDTPFDPAKFNFNKANKAEIVAHHAASHDFVRNVWSYAVALGVDVPSSDGPAWGASPSPQPILANASPLMNGHCVAPLYADLECPQVLDAFGLAAAASLCVGRIRVGFNSLGAFASVNHLHVHLMFADDLDDGVFPIERAAVASEVVRGKEVSVDLLEWPVPSFAFSVGGGGGGADDLAVAVVGAAAVFIDILKREQIPHNVLLCPDASGASLRVIVSPRLPQENFDVSKAGFNSAVCEVSGLLIAQTEERFEVLTEEEVCAALASIALEPEEIARYASSLKLLIIG